MPGQPTPTATNLVTFDVTDCRITEIGGIDPSTIINVGNAYDITVTFVVGGAFALWCVAQTLDYQVTIKGESLGVGIEANLTPTPVSGQTVAGQLTYEVTVRVPAGTLPVQEGSGMYKLVSTVVFPSSSPGVPPVPIAGYFEGPILQIIP